ncbi:unnamed protein product [Vitrella brassicaformis CCMP3155]|uniref:Uncharacterized protein n=1 Tax=Vitrella brassicaformis (strain CCMP3155) TaxID=1169540 RepID=A0A0G4EAN9_VITBC|nr:unnamed protein product [Vitrella brassicaformis CCMP3155]|eukprot:CEL92501.1 unnamed protein product [Vitrella brassicaformis CCMP3155]
MRGGRLHPRQLPGCKRACASWSPCVHRVHRQQPRPPLPPSPRVHKRGQGDLLHDWLESPSLNWEDLGVSLGPPVSSTKAKPTKVAAAGGGGVKCPGGGPAKPPAKKKQEIDNNTAPRPAAACNDGDGVSFDLCCADDEPRLQPQVRIAASAIDRALRRKDTHSNGLIRMLESKLRAARGVKASRERA